MTKRRDPRGTRRGLPRALSFPFHCWARRKTSLGGLFPVLYLGERPPWVGYSLVLYPKRRPPRVVIPCFMTEKEASPGVYSLFYTEKEASPGGLFPVLHRKGGLPGRGFLLFYTEKEASQRGITPCFTPEGGLSDSPGGYIPGYMPPWYIPGWYIPGYMPPWYTPR